MSQDVLPNMLYGEGLCSGGLKPFLFDGTKVIAKAAPKSIDVDKEARMGGYPSPSSFSLDLWNQRVAEEVWLQNIDSKDLVCKFSGMNILQCFRRYSADLAGVSRKTQKAAQCAALSFQPYISILSNST